LSDRQTSFGALLRRHRLAAGLTQEALAERAGMSVQAVSALERGVRRTPYPSTLDLLTEALRLAPAEREELAEVARRRGHPRGEGPADQPGHSLPVPPTVMVGRDLDLARACDLLSRQGVRLLALTGTAGVGKTRLGLAVAADIAPLFPDGVGFVPLASLADPGLVGPAMCQALGVREAERLSPLEALAAAIGDRRVLVLVDNFEHVMPAAPLLSDLLAMCPHLRLLVTSRIRLRLRGEYRLQVRPLPMPPPGESSAPALARNASVALFVQRAQATAAEFDLTSGNARAVAEICRRLDGLPLALEMAAPWLRLMPPQALLDRLADRLEMLVGGAPDLPDHQRTMRATLQWSYGLLSASEQALFRRLSVFAGGAPLPAVEVVCQAAGPLPGRMLDIAAGLLDKNLAESGPADLRLGQLETMREYGRELLEASGEADATARAHAAFALELLKEAETELRGPDQAGWLARLEAEHDNLRAALRWALDAGEREIALELGWRLARLWESRGHWQEGRAWFDELLSRTGGVVSEARARALAAAGLLCGRHGDFAGAAAHHQASLEVSRALGDQRNIAAALNNLGNTALSRGDLRHAARLYQEGYELRRTLGDPHDLAMSVNNLAIAAIELGDLPRAAGLLDEATALAREHRDTAGLVTTLINVGIVARRQGEYDRASGALRESLFLARDLGNERASAMALANLGHVERARGREESARRDYAEGLAAFTRLGDPRGVAMCLEGLAATAAMRGDAGLAARLYGAVAAHCDRLGLVLAPIHDPVRAEVRQALGRAAFDSAWSAGGRLSVGAATREALRAG
jgi:predicted ATPase/transcriptional regulator with XRE-family HTH domain